MTEKILKLYHAKHLERVPVQSALKALKEYGSFLVFLEFTDPRTNCLVQKLFTFFPNPQITSQGYCFLAEHDGLTLKVPSDFNWWLRKQTRNGDGIVQQKVAILVCGVYESREFDLRVSGAIRIKDDSAAA